VTPVTNRFTSLRRVDRSARAMISRRSGPLSVVRAALVLERFGLDHAANLVLELRALWNTRSHKGVLISVFHRVLVMAVLLTKRSLMLAGLCLLGVPLHACNTVEGAGEDVENVGEAVEDTTDEVGDEMGEDGDSY
jgi:predicted small secreted protein